MTTRDNDGLSKNRPVKSLTAPKKTTAGRNNQGRITSRRRGGGAKQFYRLVSYKLPEGFTATVESLEYDPNRSAHLALIKTDKGEQHYVLANAGLKVGDKIEAGDGATIEKGNRTKLANMPVGSFIYNVELTPGRGGKMVRAAGTQAQLTAKEDKYGNVKLPSGEIRRVNLQCEATLGSVGNEQHQNVKYGSAGRRRNMGRRPKVRGVVMNAVDHPHGGGDGGSHGPGRDPKTPWGQLTLGKKTRHNKSTDKYIVRSRHNAKRKK
jgi:large subunit ribosomal protein L2